jgi:hypothetical protein
MQRRLERQEAARRRQRTQVAVLAGGAALVLAAGAAFGIGLRPVAKAAQAPARPITLAADVASEPVTHAGATGATPIAVATITPSADATAPVAEPKAAAEPAAKPAPRPSQKQGAKPGSTTQRFSIAIGGAGYDPDHILAKTGSPIVLTVAQGEGCASGFGIPQLGLFRDNSSGPVTVRISKPKRGEYTYTCGMGMVTGTLVVR